MVPLQYQGIPLLHLGLSIVVIRQDRRGEFDASGSFLIQPHSSESLLKKIVIHNIFGSKWQLSGFEGGLIGFRNCNLFHKQTWARGFQNAVDVSEVKEVYLELLKKGVEFPSSEINRRTTKVSASLGAADLKRALQVAKIGTCREGVLINSITCIWHSDFLCL